MCAMLKEVEIAQIHQSGARRPLLVVDWPRGFMVAMCVAHAGSGVGAQEANGRGSSTDL